MIEMVPSNKEGDFHTPSILLFSTVGNFGGVERFICNLGAELAKRNWNTEVIFPRSSAESGLKSWCHAANLPCTFVSARFDTNQKRRLNEMQTLVSLLRSRRPNIVHFHYPSSYISLKDIFAARIANVACLASVHGIAQWQQRWGLGQISTYFASHLCRAVTSNSNATLRSTQIAGVATRKIQIIPCGVPRPLSLPEPSIARKRLSLPEDCFTVAVAARLVKQKHVADVVRAVALLTSTGRKIQMIIAGDGPERATLTRMAQESHVSAHFFGYLSQMDDFYAAADIFILPSENEAFGLVYVEVGLHGKASIGTNQGGVPDVIEDGVTGFLVAPGNTIQIADAIIHLYDSPEKCRQMGEAARQRAEMDFSIERMTDSFIDLYRSIA